MVPPLTFRPSIQFSSLSVFVTFGFGHFRFRSLSVSVTFGSRDRIPINQSICGARFYCVAQRHTMAYVWETLPSVLQRRVAAATGVPPVQRTAASPSNTHSAHHPFNYRTGSRAAGEQIEETLDAAIDRTFQRV